MKRTLTLLASMAVALAACSPQPEPAQEAAAPAVASTATTAPATPLPPSITPEPTPVPDTPAAEPSATLRLDPRVGFGETTDVAFSTEDDLTLAGTMYGEGTTAVILAHMRPTDRQSWAPFAETLAAQGYAVLTFDFRGYGDSEGSKDLAVMDRDVRAAVNYLHSKHAAGHIILIGASMGGTFLTGALGDETVVAAVIISSPTGLDGFEVDPASLAREDQPKLFIAAQDDQPYADMVAAMYAQSAGAAELVLLDGNGHGTFMFDLPQGPELEALLLDFVATNAG
ncbi:MAG: alpha/beta hydrolase [Anaerolineales bacterium]